MKLKTFLACGAAAVTLIGSSANAATINLIDIGFSGTAAQQAQFRQGFQTAAAYWGSILTNNVTVNLQVGTAALATGVIGSTGSSRNDVSTALWEAAYGFTKSNSQIDQTIVLPTLNATGGASFITNGVNATTGKDDLTTVRYDNGQTDSTRTLYLNTSLTKAMGLAATYSAANTPQQVDGTVRFSSNFAFDFDPTNGISANTFDFIGVAIHEIGHALGFVSGVDFLDIYGEGPGTSPNEGTFPGSLNDTGIYSALDMFRYSNDPTNLVPGGAARDLSAGTVTGAKFFSIDGGQTALFGNTFSQGRYNGDGQQASHWKDTAGCVTGNGLLDPTFCYGQAGEVTGLDLAAYDAMGWNLSVNALTYANMSTANIYRQFGNATAPVPEPATWAMMIMGFGLVGGAMRRRSTKVSFA